ncbi:MAG: hypothetical protein LUE64_06515 [Candidatus Gastranaerophilales bacterium]|nr:hypothetical protein [Candidatus Gastranaerophilales bacterium]
MRLNDFEEQKLKNNIRKMGKVLRFAFYGKSDAYIGTYALLASQALMESYLNSDCENENEFKQLRACLINTLSEYQKSIYLTKFKGGQYGRY